MGFAQISDALRATLIALVVAHHSVEAYAVNHPPDIPLSGPPIPGAWVFLWVNAAFFMGLFFFLAGYFTPPAFDRRGVTTFLSDRGIRLGVPLVLGTVLIVPLAGQKGRSRERKQQIESHQSDSRLEIVNLS